LDSSSIAVLVVGVIVLIVVAALWMRRQRVNKDKIPLFNCSITTDGKELGNPNSPDVYDCVEVKDDSMKPDEKT
jgi:hypothetical protein